MTPILYEKDEIDFTSQGLGSLVEIYDVDVEEQRNGLLQLTASYPVSGVRYADISVGRIILAKPNQRDDVHAFRIVSTELDISGYAVKIEADSITYDLTHNVVKHLVASGIGQAFMIALKNAIVNPSIFAFYSDIATSSTTSLNYVNPMEAIMGTTGSFLQIWGGELKRENRRVAMFNRRGRDNVATFRLGKNISGLKYSVDISSLVTRIIPTKSVQNDNQTTTILEGAPVDSQYINNYEQIYTLPLEFTDDTIKTVADLNAAAKGWFTKSANTGRDKPTVTIDIDVLSLQDSADYQDKFKNLESVSLTDTVTVYVPEYGVNVTAIVNELHYDPILDRVTKMTVGTAKQSFADSSRTQLSDLQDKIISVQNQADATAASADSKSTNYYGSVEPSHPQEGDTWFWVNGDKSGIKVFVNGNWVEPVDSDTQEKIAAGVTDAVSQANAHTDEVKQGLSSDIATAKSQAASLASTAEANAKSEATSLFSRAQNALSDAKTDLTKSIAGEASARNQAVAAANSQAQNYVNQAKSEINDTINALSVGGRNLFLSSRVLPDWYGPNGNATATVEPFDSATNMWHIVSPQNNGTHVGIWFFKYANGKLPDNSDWSYSADIKGTGIPTNFGIELGQKNPVVGHISSDWSRISQTGYIDNVNRSIVMYFDTTDSPLDVYIKLPKLETGTIPTDWTPAPEDVVLDYTTKDEQIKATISQYQETNDGHVSRLRTDVSTALGQVATKVSQTDYDKKTGDLSTKYTQVKQTVDSQATDIVDIKKTATSQASKINSISSDVDGTKQSISDIKKTQDSQSDKVNQITNDVNGTKQSITDIQTKDGKQDTRMGTIETSVSGVKSEFSSYKTTNDGVVKTAQNTAQQAVDGLTLKVSKTDYNQKTGDLSWQINEAKDTADKSARTIADIQEADGKRDSKISEVEKTAGEIKSTVSDLSTAQDKQSGDISTLKQRADGFDLTVTKVNDLTVGGRNLYLNSKGLADGYGKSDNVKATVEPFDSTTNMWHIVAAQGSGTAVGMYMWDYAGGKLPDNSDWSYSADIKGTGKVARFCIEANDKRPVKGNIGSEWSRISQTGHGNFPGSKTIVMYFDTTDVALDVYIKLPKLETGTIPTDWTPAPEDTATAISQVSQKADSISNFVRDSSGNISSDFQTALSRTSIITGSTLASSIQTQTSSQISSAITNNNGKIISLINQDSSGVQIAGENITLDGNTTVTGDFYAKGGNFKNLNASNMTVGTLSGTQVNITNINANNIVSGAISGANLNINLNTGSVVFQKGRINSSDYTTDINIDQGYISTANDNTRALIKQGMIQLVAPNRFDLESSPYMEISNNRGQNTAGAAIVGRDSVSIANSKNAKNIFPAPIGEETFSGLYTGQAFDGGWLPTKVGGANRGVVVAGGTETTWQIVNNSPYIWVGTDAHGSSGYGNRVVIQAEFLHATAVYYQSGSGGANVYVASDGALVKSSSATKYKTNIEHETDSIQGDQLLTIDPATWNDKFEAEQLERYHETGVEPERQINMEGKRYYGIIAEDLVKAGLEELVTRNEETDEVEGVEYSKIGVALIPIVRDLRNKLNEQAVEIERLKDKNK
ncbi:phage tail spike protein [Leuconostoc mesenteroides]|uniref:phage tail spike protein n=1 Tax=Leuconostoc mesenteroides TaxID=1245 RepID=UPI0023604A18|nr:phage tail spike protein [Leuconostoc mesenteroides]